MTPTTVEIMALTERIEAALVDAGLWLTDEPTPIAKSLADAQTRSTYIGSGFARQLAVALLEDSAPSHPAGRGGGD